MRAATRRRLPSLFLVLALAALTLASACARAPERTLLSADPGTARAAWERFEAVTANASAQGGPFQADATLYYSGREDSQRVSAAFWGNSAVALPLRLDIAMGPGSVIAQAREDERGIFLYVPRDNAVYHGDGKALLGFGIPVPFTLADLASLVSGRFGELFAPANGAMPQAAGSLDGATVYALTDARLPGMLSLNADGLPVSWREDAPRGWELTIDYWPDSTRNSPRKLFVKHPDGGEATLIVRGLTMRDSPFTPGQMELAVPENIHLAPLRDAR